MANKQCKKCNCELYEDEVNLIDNHDYCDECTEICVICEKAHCVDDIEIIDLAKDRRIHRMQVVCKNCRTRVKK